MDVTTRLCDHFGKKIPGISRFKVPTGQQLDRPSRRMDDTATTIDLCPRQEPRSDIRQHDVIA